MSYRDDLAAAQARADAAERRARDLEQQLDDAKREATQARTGGRGEPIAVIPARFKVSTDAATLRIEWRWFRPHTHLPLLLTWLVTSAGAVNVLRHAGTAGWFAYALPLALAIGLTYVVLTGFVNRTTVTASTGQLAIAHGPLPWRRHRVVQHSDLRQLYVARMHRSSVMWELRAILTSGTELRLIARLDRLEQGRYLEHELERFMKIRDRAVVGEVDA